MKFASKRAIVSIFLSDYLPTNLFLLTGENRFALREERKRWTDHFREKHGDSNLSVLDAHGLKYPGLLDEVAVAPFIAEKRLVIVNGVPAFEKEEMEELPEKIHPAVILLFIDPKPDKRFAATKKLMDIAEVKEFKPLGGAKLDYWINEYLKTLHSYIASDAKQLLLETVGDDQDVLSQELAKLALYTTGRSITVEDVLLLAIAGGEQNAWRLMDLLSTGDTRSVFRFMERLLERGENAYSLWNMVLWMVSSLGNVAGAVQEGKKNPAMIAKEVGVNFGAARSLTPLASRLSKQALAEAITSMADADVALKTGAYKATTEAPEELLAVLDRSLLRLGR